MQYGYCCDSVAAAKKALQENVAKHFAAVFWEIIRPNGLVKELDMLDLLYLCLVIRETLTLHPSGPFIIRECAEGCKVNGSLVKAKSSVLINVNAIMRDPEIWTNLDEFIPERFLESSNEKISEHQIRAFYLVVEGEDSLGHHLLYMLMMHPTVAGFVQRLDWKVKDRENVDLSQGSWFATEMEKPLVCYPITRLN